MSRLDDLIQELCPEGVEFRTIEDLINNRSVVIVTPSFKIKRNDYKAEGPVPIVSQEIDFISGYCDINDKNIPENQYVCFGDHSEHIKYVDFAFVQGADGLKIMYTDSCTITARYLFHSISNFYTRHNNYERHFKYLLETTIPVPPLPVQREIVQILDNFTLLTAELTAELTARKKQYEYYRDLLLTFPETDGRGNIYVAPTCENITGGGNRKDGVLCALGDISFYVTNRIESTSVDELNYVGVDNLLPNRGGKTISNYVPDWGRLIHYQSKDILIGNIRPYLKKIWLATSEGGTNGDVLTIRVKDLSKVKPEFLYHVLAADRFFLYDMQNAKGAKMPRGDKSAIMQFPLFLPPLAEQARIVSILDRFDALCNDLTSGLPAEIEARRKQYEYYRDKLLTFPEL